MKTHLFLLLGATLACGDAPAPEGGGPATDGSDATDAADGADAADGTDGTDGSDGADGTEPPQENRLANPGFELGETWWRDGGAPNHAWVQTGDAIYGSSNTFTALEGERALKIWGLYAGAVPNDSEHGLTLTDLTPGDRHRFSVQALMASPDVLTGGTQAVAFLRFTNASGGLITEVLSEPIDGDRAADAWHTLSVEATVPDTAVAGALGVRFTLPDWSATGAVYLDEAAWTSTGTGAVAGERLLVWNDEFDGDRIDPDKWTHEVLAPYTYNNELQGYTVSPHNSRVEDGQLVITALADPVTGTVTSARLNTSGKGDWRYGRIEGLLQVPAGVGTWPALWMLPTDWRFGAWPASGEIDIMEHVGCQRDVVHATVHTGAYNHMLGTQRGESMGVDATGSAHLYAIDWTEERIVFTVDDVEIFRFDNDGAGDPATWPFGEAFHVVVNLAFGGDWGGYCGIDRGALPQEYRLHHVRVYQTAEEAAGE